MASSRKEACRKCKHEDEEDVAAGAAHGHSHGHTPGHTPGHATARDSIAACCPRPTIAALTRRTYIAMFLAVSTPLPPCSPPCPSSSLQHRLGLPCRGSYAALPGVGTPLSLVCPSKDLPPLPSTRGPVLLHLLLIDSSTTKACGHGSRT